MLRYGFFFIVAVALLFLAGNSVDANEQTLPADSAAFYAAYIDHIIKKCADKQHLCASSSPVLRAYADKMLQKSIFCRSHKVQLIRSMLTRELEPKAYKVEHFVNKYFHQIQEIAPR